MIGHNLAQDAQSGCAPTQDQANPPNRILFVDDSPIVRESCARALIDSGYHVDAAEDGEAAWKALHASRYDLLITDQTMPKLSGVELVKKVRVAQMKLPVVLVSATLPTEELDQHPWLQLAATLMKPFTADELLETVRAALSATAMTASPQYLPLPVLIDEVISADSLPQGRRQPPKGEFHEHDRRFVD